MCIRDSRLSVAPQIECRNGIPFVREEAGNVIPAPEVLTESVDDEETALRVTFRCPGGSMQRQTVARLECPGTAIHDLLLSMLRRRHRRCLPGFGEPRERSAPAWRNGGSSLRIASRCRHRRRRGLARTTPRC